MQEGYIKSSEAQALLRAIGVHYCLVSLLALGRAVPGLILEEGKWAFFNKNKLIEIFGTEPLLSLPVALTRSAHVKHLTAYLITRAAKEGGWIVQPIRGFRYWIKQKPFEEWLTKQVQS